MTELPSLTQAQRRALEAVGRGEVRHRFHRSGNTYETPYAVGRASLVKLEILGLIADFREPGYTGMRFTVMLTAKGRQILETPR